MDPTVWRWIFGLTFSVGVGHFILEYGLRALRMSIIKRPTLGQPGIRGWQWGVIERPFFIILVVYNMKIAVPAMLVWIGIKMKINWGDVNKASKEKWLQVPNTSLYGDFVSMFFALIGGLICDGTLWFPTQ